MVLWTRPQKGLQNNGFTHRATDIVEKPAALQATGPKSIEQPMVLLDNEPRATVKRIPCQRAMDPGSELNPLGQGYLMRNP